ncbi:hypothetical protein H4R99_001199 [Coemansia sp. RSA 1722]|nr:hypothetical protein LPJ57_000511 [Coemansia sp. RSA 486]KAJ2237241.1 hypothetical protein IWW45_001116 [Coemansia sp. RSA 485]KAJ2601405.1 hypothetical protein GGF39_001252 [Coemansia sp. RSA 1721]KAJ2605340.1 hypothetical protein H4R99_001199 [Coemansia sp. RSA 1722]KAJ2638784.1 hypothetical protein GGF40_001382 [Coemansia sp. RSA 1286]
MSSTRPIRIVVAGGNYAGLSAIKALYSSLLASPRSPPAAIPPVEITLIDRRDGFVHYIGMTRGLTEPEYGAKLWTPYASVPWLQHPQIHIRQATITKITSTSVQTQRNNNETADVLFDYLVICLGDGRFAPIGTAATSKAGYLEQIQKAFEEIRAAGSVAVVGGGAVGIEMAADIKCDFPEKQVKLVHSRQLLLPGPFKDEFRQTVLDIMQKDIGVDVVLGNRVVSQTPQSADMLTSNRDPEYISSTVTNATLTMANERQLAADLVIRCLGTKPKYQELVDLPGVFDSTGIRVQDTMQVDNLNNIYACGDICSRDQVKLAGVAMYGGYISGRNIARAVLYGGEAKLENATRYPSKIMLLMGKDRFALQMADEIWDTERARPYATADMGLDNCIKALALDGIPAYESLEEAEDSG